MLAIKFYNQNTDLCKIYNLIIYGEILRDL